MKNKITILPAIPEQASDIAQLTMMAMSDDCCQNFAGQHHTLADFHYMMTELVLADDSQYSYRNTHVAQTRRGNIVGIVTSYDGKDLHRLRKAFFCAAKEYLGQDFQGLDDETSAGEYYVDSLAVLPEFRHQGIATRLLRAVIEAHGNNLPIGLLVDQNNPEAANLYRSIGFRYFEDAIWGGHAMFHLQYPIKCSWARHDILSEAYHDDEWGVPEHDECRLYMYLLMETMSCGLSWQMMLQRRMIFAQYFSDFNAERVANFTEQDVERIIQTNGMIHSRRKIEAMIINAQAFMRVTEEWGSFNNYIWSFSDGQSLVYRSHVNQIITSNELSDRVARDMRQRGFRYVGTIIIYSFLQAIGIINDHNPNCFRYQQLLSVCTLVD